MKYALLVYDDPDSWQSLSGEAKHAIHAEYYAVSDAPGIITHYRLRQTTIVRVEEGQTRTTEGPVTASRPPCRALYRVESDDRDSVLALAAIAPALTTTSTSSTAPTGRARAVRTTHADRGRRTVRTPTPAS
jgi:hypothetical protein